MRFFMGRNTILAVNIYKHLHVNKMLTGSIAGLEINFFAQDPAGD